MKQILMCPVCGQALSQQEKRFVCDKNHSFDIARQGYVNLLCGKGGNIHGDNAMMISARNRFLSGGYYAPLAEALAECVAKYADKDTRLLDIGCGEGYYTAHAKDALGDTGEIYAFDISKDALKAAAKRRCATLFAASAYQIPVKTAAFDMATLFFSPFCREEILRTLKAGGIFIMAYPGSRHLYGLKAAIYETPYLNHPEDTEIEGLALLEKRELFYTLTLPDSEAIADLFTMTPYYYKTGERAPSFDALGRRAEVMGVPVEMFFRR